MKYINKFYSLSILFLMLWGAQAWFTVNIEFANALILRGIICLIAFIYQRKNNIRISLKSKSIGIIAVFVLASICARQITRLESLMSFIVVFYPMLVLLNDKCNSNKIFEFARDGVAIILFISIGLHLLFLIIGFVPTLPFIAKTNSQYFFYNYIFLIKNMSFEADSIRFCSIFLEPGYLATLCTFLLYADKYNFQSKANVIILVALVLSLSLAGILLSLVGYIFYQYAKGSSIKKYVYFGIVLSVFYLGSQVYNDGNNYIQKYIFSRLELDKEKGISGNNRNSELTDYYFERMMDSGEIIVGYGTERVTRINGGGADDGSFTNQIRGTGFKVFCVINGILSAFLYMLFYFLLAKFPKGDKQIKKYRYLFAILVLITFLQASYPNSFSWLIPFILGIIKDENIQLLNKNENRNIDVSPCS